MSIIYMYHHNKINGTPKDVYLPHFEATLDFSRSEFTCP